MPLMGEFRIRLYDNVQNWNDRCKNRWRGNASRARNAYIKDKDLARIFFFFPLHFSPLHPSQRIGLDVHYFHRQFMRCFAEKFRGRDHFDEGDLYSGGTHRVKIGISRIMELLVQPADRFRFKMRRDQSIKEQTGDAFNSLHLSQSNFFLCVELYPFIFSIHRFLC